MGHRRKKALNYWLISKYRLSFIKEDGTAMGYRGVDDNPWQIVPLGRKKEKELLID